MFNFCLKARVLLVTIMKWCISEQEYKHLTRFSRFVLFNLQLVLCKRLTLLIFVTDGLFIYIYFLLFEENHQNWISGAGEKISPMILLFLHKMIA